MSHHFTLLNEAGEQIAIVHIDFKDGLNRYIGVISDNNDKAKVVGFYPNNNTQEIIMELSKRIDLKMSKYIEL